jgi:hypothetical protein
MPGHARILLFASTFAAAQVVLASGVVPVLAQKLDVAPRVSDPTPKKKLEKPDSSLAKGREKACGNDQNKCGALYQEMVNPHDARPAARLKAEKAYRDCMVKCTAAPQNM